MRATTLGSVKKGNSYTQAERGGIDAHMHAGATKDLKGRMFATERELKGLQSERASLSKELKRSQVSVKIENVSTTAEKYGDLKRRKKEVVAILKTFGKMSTIPKWAIVLAEGGIALLLLGGLIYRLMGDRMMKENVIPLLDIMTFSTIHFDPLLNAFFLEAVAVTVSSFILYHLWGNNYQMDNRRKFLRTSIIFSLITGVLLITFALL